MSKRHLMSPAHERAGISDTNLLEEDLDVVPGLRESILAEQDATVSGTHLIGRSSLQPPMQTGSAGVAMSGSSVSVNRPSLFGRDDDDDDEDEDAAVVRTAEHALAMSNFSASTATLSGLATSRPAASTLGPAVIATAAVGSSHSGARAASTLGPAVTATAAVGSSHSGASVAAVGSASSQPHLELELEMSVQPREQHAAAEGAADRHQTGEEVDRHDDLTRSESLHSVDSHASESDYMGKDRVVTNSGAVQEMGKPSKNPWGRLSGGTKTVIVVVATFFIFLVFITAILVPIDKVTPDTTHTYYIAAETVLWDYAPQNRCVTYDRPFNAYESFWMENGTNRIGDVYYKARYVGYTDDTYTEPIAEDKNDPTPALGYLGPLLRARSTDKVEVYFRNNLPFNTSLYIQGMVFDTNDESVRIDELQSNPSGGAFFPGSSIPPGGEYLYKWKVSEASTPSETSSIALAYHPYQFDEANANAGLVGALVVVEEKEADNDYLPKDVDREYVIFYNTVDENQSPYLEQNIQEFAPNVDPSDPDFIQSNLMSSVNGMMFGNLPDIVANQDDIVRWYSLSIGEAPITYPIAWEGNSLNTATANTVTVSAGVTSSNDMTPSLVGRWLMHCAAIEVDRKGMQALYTIEPGAA
eukprot:CAMPEP_0177674500 /NCGR_PEP_ID=MMETSP0447-20121125/26595_1 /TAXON_ID=0 /ORGANISM="Stygamoeba regulata, Strain BSH-02190019" /LENGTH=641 /DNA_ID=CAMNT_0019182613 /DNA_START=20 /DNA_END=1945 /DNA_ORIENTATION=+